MLYPQNDDSRMPQALLTEDAVGPFIIRDRSILFTSPPLTMRNTACDQRVCLPARISSKPHIQTSPNFCAHYGPITIAIRARFEYDSTTIRLRFERDTTSYEELCAFEQ